MLDHFFPLLFPKDSKSIKILDIRLWEVGAKRPLNGTSKVNRQTNTQTARQTDGHFDLEKASAQRADALKTQSKTVLKNVNNSQKRPIQSKMVKNGQNLSTTVNIGKKNGQYGEKRSKRSKPSKGFNKKNSKKL